MKPWDRFLESVLARVRSQKIKHEVPELYYRGHANKSWRLEPGLARIHDGQLKWYSEERLYWAFRMRGAHLLPPNVSDWTVLFYMQHFGLPTRLLDWTNSFANALHFALEVKTLDAPCIWVLDPYKLNCKANGSNSLSNISVSHPQSYLEFMRMPVKPIGAIATDGDSTVERIRSQAGAFTLHGDLSMSLEQYCPEALSRHVLPKAAIEDAFQFLELAGVNSFSIFPDLGGLARDIVKRELAL